MSSKLLVVGDSYCMNYIRMRNHIHSGQWPNGTTRKESYELFDWKTKKVKQFEWHPMNECKLWPEIVAEHYNMDLVNLSESGAGNTSISAMALDYIISNKVDKAIIVWSGFGRWEFEALQIKLKKRLFRNGELIGDYKTGNIKPKNNTRSAWLRYHNHAKDKNLDEYNNFQHQTNEFDNLAKVGAFSLETSVYTWFRLVFSMQEICKSLNIDLKMFQSGKPLKTHAENMEAAKIMIKDPYLSKINDKIFKGFPAINYIGGTCFSDILREIQKDSKYTISELDKHPNEEGHKLLAEYVIND